MQQAKHVKPRQKKPHGLQVILLSVLVCVFFGAIFLFRPGKTLTIIPPHDTSSVETPENDVGNKAEITDSPSSMELGELLESGTGINDHVFGGIDYSGMASDLSDSSFCIGKTAMAYDSNAQPIISPLTVYYREDIVVKMAILDYNNDTFELYTSSLDEFTKMMNEAEYGVNIAIFLESSETDELWAKEIRMYRDANSENQTGNRPEMTDSPSSTGLGELLESGTNLNANFYAGFNYFGTASDLTESTFLIGRTAMAYNSNAQPIISPLTVHYSEDTVVRQAVLHYGNDTYELYASSLDEFVNMMNEYENGVNVVIYLENSDSEELWVREIRIYTDVG